MTEALMTTGRLTRRRSEAAPKPVGKIWRRPGRRGGEAGYALVALIGVMLFSLILTTAAAPKMRFESQREKEEEMLWRGQQVAAALTRFSAARGGLYPTDLSELVKGIEVGVKKVRFLRPSALCDPMTPCTSGSSNWRPVHPGDPLVRELLEAYIATQQKGTMMLPPPPAALVTFAQMGSVGAPGQRGSQQSRQSDDNGNGSSSPVLTDRSTDSSLGFRGPGSGDTERGPIIGVVSRKNDRMFRSYFGIEKYDHTLFFPAIPVIAGGFVNPLALAAIQGGGPPQQCAGGGVLINGKCWGGLTPGILCRGPNGETVPCPK